MKKHRYIYKTPCENFYISQELYSSKEEFIKKSHLDERFVIGPCPEYPGLFEVVDNKQDFRIVYKSNDFLIAHTYFYNKEEALEVIEKDINNDILHAINIRTGEIIKKEDLTNLGE